MGPGREKVCKLDLKGREHNGHIALYTEPIDTHIQTLVMASYIVALTEARLPAWHPNCNCKMQNALPSLTNLISLFLILLVFH